MSRSQYQRPGQLVLVLVRPNPVPLVEQGTKGLIETLADLLLEALNAVGAPEKGGVDEHQDHA